MVLVQCLVDSASSEQCTADRNRAGLGKRAETASGKSSGDPVHTKRWSLQGIGDVVGRKDPTNRLQ